MNWAFQVLAKMNNCFFVSDLHGKIERYKKLFHIIEKENPDAVFIGGDILPSSVSELMKGGESSDNFVKNYLAKHFSELKRSLKNNYPQVFIILGNDDGKSSEDELYKFEKKGIWQYIHFKKVLFKEYEIYGYSYVPPTPFLLKDWEKYDVSRYVDPGCVSPEEGLHTEQIEPNHIKYATIQKDLNTLVPNNDISNSIFLFHSPPYQTKLDRAALDNKKIDHVALDVHVGSIAIKKFIEEKQPLLTLHGHIHESTRLTGSWKEQIGKTICFSAAHDGPELALIRFDPENLDNSYRELI